MGDLDQEPYPDVVVRTRLRRGALRHYLSPATVRGEEWLLGAVPGADSGDRPSCEVSRSDVDAWVGRMCDAGLIVKVGDGA